MAVVLTRAPAVSSTPAAWHGLGAGSVLYLASQVTPTLAGVTLLLLMFASAFGPLQRPDVFRGPSRALALRPELVVILVALSGLVFIVQRLALPNEVKPFSAAHLLAYLVVALARRDSGPNWPALPLVRAVSVVNVLLLGTLFMPVLGDIFWYENLGQRRFRAFYFEPSIAALVYVLNLIVLWHGSPRPKSELPFVVCNLACLAMTFSGSGFVMLAVVVLSSLGSGRLRGLGWYALAALPLGVAWTMTESGSSALQELVLSRAAGIATQDYDNSVHLRAVAPLLFSADLFDAGINTWLGAGIGGIESYVDMRAASLWFLVDFAGNLVPHVNNGYVVVLALLGVPAGSLALIAWFGLWTMVRVPRALKAYALLYPLFSGFVIHPLLWLLVVMAGLPPRNTSRPPGRQPCTSP